MYNMLTSSPFVFALLVTWITPVWMLSVGAALGVAVLAVAYGVLRLAAPRLADAAYWGVRESVLLPIFYVSMLLTGFAVAGIFLVPGLPAKSLVSSVSRISSVGVATQTFEIPPATASYELKDFKLQLPELRELRIESDQPLTINTNIRVGLGQTLDVNTSPGQPVPWVRPPLNDRDKDPAPEGETKFLVRNVGSVPASLTIESLTDIQFPEMRIVPGTALGLVLLVVGYLALRGLSPKIAAIAATTAKEAMAQPLFYLALGLGAFLLLSFIVIPYYTFGEDVKMLKDSGLTLIMILAMIVAVWSASVSVSEEVEGRTALTVLSKPVRRRQFILGKFLGVLGPVVVLFVVLGVLFLITVSYKVVYDSREVAKSEPPWQLCYLEMAGILPGLVLAFFETVVLAAISVAISTRLPMLANLIVCATIYVLGHLVPMLVNSSVGKFEIVRFVGQFIATVLPVLDHFNIQAAVAAGAAVPTSYLWMALVYCLVYSTIAMLLGLAMFEDRDLA
jgi:ABC-type transport system involved in multi-copper enzyme maturation permease subunit